MIRIILLLGISAVVGLDQLFKWLVVQRLGPGGQTEALLGLVRLRYTENTGAAFSMFDGATSVLAVLTALMLLFCLFLLMAQKIKPKLLMYCVAAVTAGGIGNLIDRVFRGYVIDYIEPVFVRFAIFNFADCFVTIGAGIMIAYLLVDLLREMKNPPAKA